MDLLYKYAEQKVFLFTGFRITPGILTYSYGKWWQVVGPEHVSVFLSSWVTSLRVLADIPYIVVSDSTSYTLSYRKGG